MSKKRNQMRMTKVLLQTYKAVCGDAMPFPMGLLEPTA